MAEDKTYENEVRINSYPRDNKKVNDKIYSLKADIDRIQEEYDNLKTINDGHQKLNGELRIEVKKLTEENQKLKDPLNQLRKDGDIQWPGEILKITILMLEIRIQSGAEIIKFT